MKPYLKILSEGGTLSQAEAEQAMTLMMEGHVKPEEIAGFLMGLRGRGETLDELTGFTKVMRAHAVPVTCDDADAIDLCGTGGDQSGTFNISTTAALVCAGAGVTVAKHGNRSVSSQSGSADVLEALGVKTALRKAGVEYCLREAGIAFIFAPYFHPALRHVMPVRRALGVRTFFNILGPLCNPAGVQRQLVGAFSQPVALTMAEILLRLGARHIVTAHAADGLDEFTLTGPTTAYTGRQGDTAPMQRTVTPEQHGLSMAPASAFNGGDAEANADITRQILDGQTGPQRDIVLLNAAYALYTSGHYDNVDAALTAARYSIDSGAAHNRLHALAEASHAAPAD